MLFELCDFRFFRKQYHRPMLTMINSGKENIVLLFLILLLLFMTNLPRPFVERLPGIEQTLTMIIPVKVAFLVLLYVLFRLIIVVADLL